MGEGHFTKAGHYVFLTTVNENGEVFVADPNNGNISSEIQQTTDYWSFDDVIKKEAIGYIIVSNKDKK